MDGSARHRRLPSQGEQGGRSLCRARRREDDGGLCTEEPAGCLSSPSAGSHCLNGLPVHRSIVAGRRGQANGGEPAVRIVSLATRRSGRLSWRLRGAAEAGATSYHRGSSSRGTPGHYAPGPVTARKLPRRRVGPACEQPSGRLGQFQHAAKRLGRRRFGECRFGECRPGACNSIAGIRRGVCVS